MTIQDGLALLTTLKLAMVSTVWLLVLGTPLAWWLAQTESKFKPWIQSIVSLPLVLPPTVIGFYLLLALGKQGVISSWMNRSLAFTFSGLVVGSVIYSMPFVVQPLQNCFSTIGKTPLEVAATLRANRWDAFWHVMFPLARPGFITAAVLGFAHTVGEFGIVLMIGGNIPGETRVLSVAIYEHVEALAYGQAHVLAGVLVLLSFLLLAWVYGLQQPKSASS